MIRRNWTEGPLALVFMVVVDLLALFDAFALAYLCRFQWGFFVPPLHPPAPPMEYIKAWVVAAYLTLLLFHAYGLYDRNKTRDPIDVMAPLLRAGAWALLLVLSLSYFYRDFTYSRISVLYTCLFSLLLCGMFRTAWEAYRNRSRALGPLEPVVLVGSRTVPRFLMQRIAADPTHGFRVAAVVDSVAIEPEVFGDIPTGRLDELPRLIEESGARQVLIGHPALGHHQLLEIVEHCDTYGIRAKMVPATFDLLVEDRDFQEVGGIPLMSINERRQRPGYRIVKRGLDLVLASTLIVILAPVFALVALAVRISSPGAVIYRQARVGRGGVTFQILKFRTMVQEAESLLPALVDLDSLEEPVFKVPQDPRVTAVGRVLRRFSLDELPQLFNVVRGEMSLVGPRPEEQKLVDRYDIWQRRRLKLTPGITGLQQLYSRGSSSLEERVRWDVIYLRKESLLLDLWILFRTIGVVLRGRGTL